MQHYHFFYVFFYAALPACLYCRHFIRYKCKIARCLDSQTLSGYISTIILDDNEKLSINEVVEVLTGVGTFTSTSSFDTIHKASNLLQ